MLGATISLVESTRPDALSGAAQRLASTSTSLDGQIAVQAQQLARLRNGWQGTAATAAIARAEQDLARQRELLARLAKVQSVLNAAGTNLAALRTQIGRLAAQARSLGGIVADDGTVTGSGR